MWEAEMHLVLKGLAAALLVATAVQAGEPAPNTGKLLYVCDGSARTERAFAREFGEARFVKAEDVVAQGEAWTAPRCITQSEMRRLRQIRDEQGRAERVRIATR